MQRKKKIAIGATLFLAGLLVFSGTILPYIVKSRAIAALVEATGRETRIGSLAINPFTLTVTVSDFVLEEKGQEPLLAVGRLRVSLSTASLYRRALVFNEVAIDRPAIRFVRTAPNRYSFSDILDRQPKNDKKTGLLFSFNNITLSNGSIDFTDRAVGAGRLHTVRNLELGIPFISTIPYYVETYTTPRITALVNGTPFSLNGRLKPLSKSLETSLHVGIKRLSLPEYLSYSPVALPANLRSGLLTVDADLTYRVSADKKPEVTVSGIARLDDLALFLKDGRPLLKLPLLEVKASKLEVVAKRFALDSVLFDGLQFYLARNKAGQWMYESLFTGGKPDSTPPPAQTESGKPQPAGLPAVQVSSFAFRNGSVQIDDQAPPGGFTAELSGIDAVVDGFSTTEGASAGYRLSFAIDRRSRFVSTGSFSPAPEQFSGIVELTGFDLGHGWPYLAPHLTAPVAGRIDLSAELAYTREAGLAAANGKLLLANLSTRYGKDRLELPRVALSGVSYSQKLNRLDIADISLSRGAVSLSRERDGALSILSLVRRDTAPVSPTAPAAPKQAPVPRPTFSYRLGKLLVTGLDLAFSDRTRDGEPEFSLNNTRLSLNNLQGPQFTPAALRFSATLGKDAPLAANGTIVPTPFKYTGNVTIGRVPLRDFEAYLPDNVNVFIVGGLLDADMKIDVSLREGTPAGSFQGSVGVRDFYSMDTVEEQDLLKWESLQFDEMQGTIAPFSLNIRQVALNNCYSRIIVRKDGTLNLQNLVTKPAQEKDGTNLAQSPAPALAVSSPAVGTAAPAAQAPPRQIAIGAVTIQEGTIAFSDMHLSQHFHATFRNLGGRVSGLSSEEAKFADVDLRGNLENRSPLQITGRINPLREDLLVDLKISFRDIELPLATPYSGTFLGYAIDQGKLFLDLKYLIEKKQLNSENKVFIDQFTFGRKVESEKATALPVRLAVALLKDRKGEIHLDLPVTGRTDDPEFSVWGVVWQMVKNLFAKAATSPFALLSSLAGGGSDVSSVSFAPGASLISPVEGEKLQKLAKALVDRPAIRLEVAAFIDRQKDPEGYRNELLKKKMQMEKFLQMAKEKRVAAGQTSDALEILPEEHSRLLKAVYEKEKFPKPRTIIGTLKTLPDSEMLKLILANTTVGEEQLRGLAHDRAAAVTGFLVGEGKLPLERVFEKAGDIYASPKDGSGSARVEFAVVVK